MLVRSSFIRRSRRLRDVTYLPSRPASGDVLTWKYIASVGSSTMIGGSASGSSSDASVVPIDEVVDAGDEHDVAGRGATRPAVRSRPVNWKIWPIFARARNRARCERAAQHGDFLARGDAAAADAADAEPTDVARIVERADLELQRRRRDRRRGRARAPGSSRTAASCRARRRRSDGSFSSRARRRVERVGGAPWRSDVERGPAVQRRRVDDRESRAGRRWRRAGRRARTSR